MVGNQEEFLLRSRVDIIPLLHRIAKSGIGFKGQRHGSIRSVAVNRFGEPFELLHHNHFQTIRGVESHVGKQQLAMIYRPLASAVPELVEHRPPGDP